MRRGPLYSAVVVGHARGKGGQVRTAVGRWVAGAQPCTLGVWVQAHPPPTHTAHAGRQVTSAAFELYLSLMSVAFSTP